ncbi:transposase [Streptomyces scopuliridis]|uniref:Transposase n=1 Tax=Streptomyces scopuliridis TaxID=452529 RepID=A0ACD4ZX83_9ACTN|nr:transposase [Streptomyces scopuliridis]WSC03685.1 transposase [Streptomyces scopuliridis]
MRHTHTAWRFERCGRAMNFGRPPEHDPRNIMDAVLYVDRTGVQWRYLPPTTSRLFCAIRFVKVVALLS